MIIEIDSGAHQHHNALALAISEIIWLFQLPSV
jgi:hypothetical protein